MRNRIDQLLLGGMLLLTVAFVFVLRASLNEHMVKEGDQALDFSIQTDSGRKVSTSDFGGKLLVLNFWASWCQPCVEEMPTLDHLQKQLGDKGLVVLAVSIDEDPSAYHQFLRKYPVTFQTARQGNDKLNVAYGSLKVPETYIIDRSGKVLKKVVGKETWDDERVVSYVQSLL